MGLTADSQVIFIKCLKKGVFMQFAYTWLKAMSFLLISYMLSGCSFHETQNSQALSPGTGSHHEAQNNKYLPPRVDTKIVDQNSSKTIEIVFYRIGGTKAFVPTVKVNERVVGSLLPDNYAKTFACNGNIKVGVANRGDRLSTTSYHVTIKDNSNTIFMKVLESPEHKFTLQQMDPESTKKKIKQFNLKSNIINRYVPQCKPTQKRSIKTKPNALSYTQIIYFDTDGFTIRKEGIQKIKTIAKLAKEYKNLTEATLESYADYRGSKNYNKKLAYNRAISVKKYFKSLYPNCSFKIINHGEVKAALTEQDLKRFNLYALLQPYRKVVISLKENRGV